jgi:hypothetical protein
MSRLGVKGDHLTLTAFMNFYGADLVIYSPSFEHQFWLQCRRLANNDQPKAFYLAIVGDNYQSLLSPDELTLRSRIEMIRMKNAKKLSERQRLLEVGGDYSSECSNESDSASDDSEHEGECSRQCKKHKIQHNVSIASPSTTSESNPLPTSSAHLNPHSTSQINSHTLHTDHHNTFDYYNNNNNNNNNNNSYNNNNIPLIVFEKNETLSFDSSTTNDLNRSTEQQMTSPLVDVTRPHTLSVRTHKHRRKRSNDSNSRKRRGETTRSRGYNLKTHSLVSLCVAKIVQNIEHYPPFAHLLPHELLYDILNALGEQKKLSDVIIERLLEPSMRYFVLKVLFCSNAHSHLSNECTSSLNTFFFVCVSVCCLCGCLGSLCSSHRFIVLLFKSTLQTIANVRNSQLLNNYRSKYRSNCK